MELWHEFHRNVMVATRGRKRIIYCMNILHVVTRHGDTHLHVLLRGRPALWIWTSGLCCESILAKTVTETRLNFFFFWGGGGGGGGGGEGAGNGPPPLEIYSVALICNLASAGKASLPPPSPKEILNAAL